MTSNAVRACGFAACLAILSAGCTGLHSNRAAPQVYTLEPAPATAMPVAPAGAVAGSVTVQVLRPLAAPWLDTDRIALVHEAQRLDYYAASRWPAALPDLLQTLAIDAVRAAGRFGAVQPGATAFVADDVLQIEIRRCQAEYAADGLPVVHVQLLATLGRQSDRTLVASITAETSRPALENRMQAVVAAFQGALGDALAQLAANLTP